MRKRDTEINELKRNQRIAEMEQALDISLSAIKQMSESLTYYRNALIQIEKLREYYQSENWQADYDDDASGKLPQVLKRGVLSQDGISDMLYDNEELIEELKEIVKTEM